MTVVKICGITELDHAIHALEAGVDLLGFVFAPSRRQIAPEGAERIVRECRRLFLPELRGWRAVGVFANQPLDFVLEAVSRVGLDVVQLSGRETPEYCHRLALPLFKTVHVPELARCSVGNDLGAVLLDLKASYRATRLLLDSGGSGRWGGTGTPFRWDDVGDAARDCLVAGGLNPSNVARAVALMRPWGVDVSSGVETDGKKNPDLISRFVLEVRRCDAHVDDLQRVPFS